MANSHYFWKSLVLWTGIWLGYFNVGDHVYAETTSLHPSRTVVAGEDVVFICSIPDVQPEDKIQFRKDSVTYQNVDGTITLSIDADITLDREQLAPALIDNDRYIVPPLSEEGNTVYKLMINKVEPEDMGNISCIHSKSTGDVKHIEKFPLVVVGPAKSLNGFVGQDRGQLVEDLQPWPTDYHFNSSYRYSLRLSVNFPSTLLPWRLFIGSDMDTPEFNLTDQVTSHGGSESANTGPLVKANLTAVYEHGFRPRRNHNGKMLYGIVVQPTEEPDLMVSMAMNVTFRPEIIGCDPGQVVAPTGTENAKLTCQVQANPPADVGWHVRSRGGTLDQDIDRFTVQNVIEGDIMTSTLTISQVMEGDHDSYYVTAKNSDGYNSGVPHDPRKRVDLLHERISRATILGTSPFLLALSLVLWSVV